MPTRSENLDVIARFLRDRYEYHEKMTSSLKGMSPEQKDAIARQETYYKDIQFVYNLRELSDELEAKGFYYDKLRYNLIGADDKAYRKQGQPRALSRKGIAIDYSEGKTKPRFYFNRQLLMAAAEQGQEVTPAVVPTKPEPDAAPAESVTSEEVTPEVKIEECNLKHVPRWVEMLLLHGINESRVRVDKDKVMMIDGFPVIGIKYVTADMIEGDIPDDWKPIVYDNDDLVSKDTSTK